jgi:hypothetical protein
MRKILFAALAATTIGSALAAELPVTSQAEIEGLLSTLGSSECQFYRNGSWHNGGEAESHLRMKYEALRRRGSLHSTEEFIEGAATKSSLSGEPYAVKCSNEPPQPSAAWLGAKLKVLRAPPAGRKS